AAIAAAFTAAAGNIINDYFDIEIDKINKPGRPLAAGYISKKSALIFYGLLNAAALFAAIQLNFDVFLITVSTQVLLFFYSYKLKNIPLAGNLVVALLTGLVFIFGGAAAGNVSKLIIPALFAFLINLIREIIKDAEDVKGDSAAGLKTFPIVNGMTITKVLIFFLTLILILFTFQPFIFKIYNIEFFIIVMVLVNPILVYFFKSLYYDQSQKNLNHLSTILKLN